MSEGKFASINIHLTDECNYSCCFCFSSGKGCSSDPQIGLEDWKPILYDLIKNRGVTKINFAGGEPLKHPDLIGCIRYAKELGATTSIITNSSLLNKEFFRKVYGYLDWIGFSIDSVDDYTEVILGRHCKGCRHLEHVKLMSDLAHDYEVKVKLNIVVNRFCLDDDFSEFIRRLDPQRVKFLQVSRVSGMNDTSYGKISITAKSFEEFKTKHRGVVLSNGVRPVFESESDILESYLMLDPSGQLRISTPKGYEFVPYEIYWANPGRFNVDYEKYVKRGGIYDWASTTERD